jgi:hypothetical protein
MDRRLSFVVFALALLLFSACKNRNLSQHTGERPQRKSAEFLVAQLKAKQLKYDWFVGKAKAHFDNKDNSIGFMLQIRQQRDSLTWLTVKKVSVEGARMLFRPDSIQVLNHQENEYAATDFANFKTRFAMPLDFGSIQQVVVGNPIWLDDIAWKANIEGHQHRLHGHNRAASTSIEIFINGSNYNIEKIAAQIGNLSITADISDYETVKDSEKGSEFSLPHRINLTFESPKDGTVKLNIHYNSISLEPPSNVRFEVPEHYKTVEIPKF